MSYFPNNRQTGTIKSDGKDNDFENKFVITCGYFEPFKKNSEDNSFS